MEKIINTILSAQDITLASILLLVIVAMGYWIMRLDKKIEERNKYSREQDKYNLEILGELTNTLKEKQNNDKEVKDKVNSIGDTVRHNNVALNNLSTIIHMKLTNMD